MVTVAVPLQVYLLTGSSLAVGLVGLAQAVPIVLAGLYAGALADHWDRRRMQLISKTVVACGSLALAIGSASGRASLVMVFCIVAVTAAAGAADQTARAATIPRLVPREQLPSAISVGQLLQQTASIVGPAVAGPIIATAGLRWAYAIDALLFLPAAGFIWLLSSQPTLEDHALSFGWHAPAEAIRYVARRRLLIGLFSSDLVAMIFGMPTAVFPALALGVLRVGAGGLGLLYAAPAAGALVGSLFSGWVRHVGRQGAAVFCAIAVWGAAIAGFGLAGRTLWLSLPLLGLAGAGDLVSTVFRNTILQLSIPDSMRGRMTAFHQIVVTTGPRLGDLEAGSVATLAGPTFSVVSGGVACVVGIAVLAVVLPELRRWRAPDAPPA